MTHSAASNPFRQGARHWQIRMVVQREWVMAIEEAFEDWALAISDFEMDEVGAMWGVDILMDSPKEKAEIESRLALVTGLIGIQTPSFTLQMVERKDWIAEVERNFPPFSVGRFYVHGNPALTPAASIGLWVSAGAAFGSGEHATTRGCLMALVRLARHRKFYRPLDMGCGSGILAIAAAKLWHVKVVGVDIDPVSIGVAKENATRNQVRKFMQFVTADGYRAAIVRTKAPFDLIMANILARPLAKMAKELAHNLAPGGLAVLSGLLTSQERFVLAAHHAQGLHLIFRIRCDGWSTLVIGN